MPSYADCAEDSLGSVGGLDLGKHVRDVVADRLRPQAESLADRGVAKAVRDQREDLVLAVSQVGKGAGTGGAA
jgi:hypothetical protein